MLFTTKIYAVNTCQSSFFFYLYSLLFPDQPELVPELFQHSGVDDTLRAQQLTLEDFESLCNTYETLKELHQFENLEKQ